MPRAIKNKREKNKSYNILNSYLYILMACTYTRLNNTSIHKTASKNKAKPYQSISAHKAKLITFFIWPIGASENIFEVKSSGYLKLEVMQEVSHNQIIC